MSYVQSQRHCSMSTALGEDVLLIHSLQGNEAASSLFEFTVEAVSTKTSIPCTLIVGTTASIRFELADGSPRHLHGVVTRFQQGGRDQRLTRYRLELRPWPWLLTHRQDCRIFQNLSVPQIVEQVFQRAGFEDFEFRLSGSYEPRTYCVQYRETDFAFVSRLLEEVGIAYGFTHASDRHTLILADAASKFDDCPGAGEVFMQGTDGGNQDCDEILSWQAGQELHTGNYSLKDYNFEDPGNALAVTQPTSAAIGGNARYEVYDYHPEEYPNTDTGSPIAEIRIQERETIGVHIEGTSECRDLVAAHRFTLRDHFNPEFSDQQFLVTAVHHELRQAAPFETNTAIEQEYSNRFECVPATLNYRPARTTPRPRITGPQTAVVVGPAGEEIYVDEYGRVKVQFHWDREGQNDENSSCWIRVSQSWAAKKFGAVANPRIGDEVIVEFLEGDPDKPIITGRVYNARMKPPYDLPANKTQTGIKSRSSKGGSPSNFNEFRFEDKKGSEEIYIQAEKDQNVLIKNDSSENVGNNETVTIGNDRSEKVGNDESIAIGNNQSVQVGVNQSETVGVNKNIDVGANLVINAGTSIVLKCGASTISMNAAGIISISGMLVTMSGTACANVAAPITNVAGAALLTNTGAINLVNGIITRAHGSSVGHFSGGKAELVGDSETLVQGGKVKIN